jgi:hypothetical protein
MDRNSRTHVTLQRPTFARGGRFAFAWQFWLISQNRLYGVIFDRDDQQAGHSETGL